MTQRPKYNHPNQEERHIMDTYVRMLQLHTHTKALHLLSATFKMPLEQLEALILLHKDGYMHQYYPRTLSLGQGDIIPPIWNGYCPESWAKGTVVRMRLNDLDFYESEATGLQIALSYPGVQATIITWRGTGKYKGEQYADERNCCEFLSPQLQATAPFCGVEIFKDGDEIQSYINLSIN